MRVERDDGRREPGCGDLGQYGSVTAVHAVEGADRDSARLLLDLLRAPRYLHASLASASSGGMIVSGSASPTSNGPISVRRSVRQWPPSASAIERT